MPNGRDPGGPVGTGAPTAVSTPFGTPPDLPTAKTSIVPAPRLGMSTKLSPGVTTGKDICAPAVGKVPTGVNVPDGELIVNVRISPFGAAGAACVTTKATRPPESWVIAAGV